MANDLPKPDWNEIATNIESASSMVPPFQKRKWSRQYTVDTHRNTGVPVGALYCYNCCGSIIHIHKKKFKVSKEEGIEIEQKNIEKIGAEIGASLGIDKIIGVKVSGSISNTTSLSKKIDKKIISEMEEEIELDGHAKNCEKLYQAIYMVTRFDMKGIVAVSRSWELDTDGKIQWSNDTNFDTSALEISVSSHIGPLSGVVHTSESCEPCRENKGLIVENPHPAPPAAEPAHQESLPSPKDTAKPHD